MDYLRTIAAVVLVFVSAGCTSTSWNNALGTPKNPSAVYADPSSKYRDDDNAFIIANYGVLLEAVDKSGAQPKVSDPPVGYNMRRYLAAGYTLSDMYCSRYFRKSDESSRRRKFGRSVTNDAGTAITTVLGLVNAGQDAVTGLAAATGMADSSWRNYDDSFMISPELSSVQGLVEAAQDNYRSRTLGDAAQMPADFSTAQHMIQRYANLCSHLGMRRLLQEAATTEQKSLNTDTNERNKIDSSASVGAAPGGGTAGGAGGPAPGGAAPFVVVPDPGGGPASEAIPATALPAPTTNRPN